MDRAGIEKALLDTIADFRLSRGEKKALRSLLSPESLSVDELAWCRGRAFDIAGDQLDSDPAAILDWLRDVVGLLEARKPAPPAEVRFNRACLAALRHLIRSARRSLDVAVYSFTDNRVVDDLLKAAESMPVRLITDRQTTDAPGSDAVRLAAKGIPVRWDDSDAQMHHKFAVVDGRAVVTGSYNWTRSAAGRNYENLIILRDAAVVARYVEEFDHIWNQFEPLS